MQTFDLADTRAEPAVSISMRADHIVVRARQRLDLDATGVLVNAVAAAVTAGAGVEIDLGHGGDVEPPSGWVAGPGAPPSEHGTVRALTPGCIRLSTYDHVWTIDINRARCCRSATPVDPHFVDAGEWTPIRGLWATAGNVTVLTDDDSYWSTRVGWTAHPQRPQGPPRRRAA